MDQVVYDFLVTDEESIRLKKTRTAARKLNDILPTNDEFESIPLERLGNKVSDIESGMSGLPMRELLGLDKMLQKLRGELTVNVVKLSEVDNKIKYEQDKLEQRWRMELNILMK